MPYNTVSTSLITRSRTHRVNAVDLQVIEAGPPEGPVVMLLHGFPDFWWGWRHQIAALAAQGYHVVVPDQRGYNLSSKPKGINAYNLETLAADIIALADAYHQTTFRLVGHDWGGIIAWWVAAHHPGRVEQLVVINAPHPDVFPRFVRLHPRQAFKSSYAAFFQLPYIPELILKIRQFTMLRRSMVQSSRSGTFSAVDMEHYKEAWNQPNALTGMLNYYRALARRPLKRLSRISPPTLMLWGEQDKFLELGIAKASLKMCDNAQKIFFDKAGHWVKIEEAEAVNEALSRFFESSSPSG